MTPDEAGQRIANVLTDWQPKLIDDSDWHDPEAIAAALIAAVVAYFEQSPRDEVGCLQALGRRTAARLNRPPRSMLDTE